MDTILLLRKEGGDSLVIFDDFFAGQCSGDWYVVEQFGKIYKLEGLIEFWKWPCKNGEHSLKLLWCLKGHNSSLLQKVEFYEDESFDIEL